MSQPANTFDSYDAVGNREDLSDEIHMLKTDDTPFFNSLKKKKATGVFHEWQTDGLGSADENNAHAEGGDFGGTAITPTGRVGNRCQIFKKEPVVSGTQEAVTSAGRPKEMAYQKVKMMKQMKQDIEAVFTRNQAPVVGDSATARKLRPLCSWYSTNVSKGAGGAEGSATTARTDGTQRVFTENLLKDICQKIFDNGGDPDLILTGSYNKRVLSGFAGNANRQINAADKKLIATIDLYESDFGQMKVVADRHSRARDVHVLDTSLFAIAELRPLFSEPLGKTGDNVKEQMILEATLEVGNEAASGLIADLTTAAA